MIDFTEGVNCTTLLTSHGDALTPLTSPVRASERESSRELGRGMSW